MTTWGGAPQQSPFIIGIAGPSGAGKTTLTEGLAAHLSPGAAILALDSYYRDLSQLPLEERASRNFDEPGAIEHELLTVHLQELRAGSAIRKPVYDFATHTRMPTTEIVRPAAFLLVEGLFVLYWESLRSCLDLAVYVDAEDCICLQRRLQRDVNERGRTPESVHEQYSHTVRPMAERYVLPTREHAGIVLSGEDDFRRAVRQVAEQVGGA